MRLSVRTALIVTTALVVGFGATFTTAGVIILEGQKELEAQEAQNGLDRARALLENDRVEMEGVAIELTQITLTLMASGSLENNQSSQLGASLFAANDIDFLYMAGTDPSTGQAFGAAFSMRDGTFAEVEPELNASIIASPYAQRPLGLEGLSGMADLAGELYILAAQPLVLPGMMDGARMVVARALDADYLAQIGADTKQDLDWTDAPAGPVVLTRDGLQSITITEPLHDVDDRPIAGLSATHDRSVYMSGLVTFLGFLTATAIVSAGLIVLTLWLLRRYVVNRIRFMGRKMTRLRRDEHLRERLDMGGEDELSDMATAFDGLMDTLEQRTKRLDRFASVVSHDLQSPLSTFTLNIALLRKQAEARGDLAALAQLDRMERTCEHMQRHIRGVLDDARDRNGDHQKLHLDELVDEVLEDLAGDVARSGARIERGPLPTVMGDAGPLRQVFQNLLQNAIKYAKPGQPPEVRIQARRHAGRWQIRVRDQGRGVDPHDAARMVEAFSRLENVDGTSGHGVGLSICAEIVERHGGRLRIDGRPGEGTAILFDLPAPARKRPKLACAAARPHPQA